MNIEILDFINKYNIVALSTVRSYAEDYRHDWYLVLVSSRKFKPMFKAYMISKRGRMKRTGQLTEFKLFVEYDKLVARLDEVD